MEPITYLAISAAIAFFGWFLHNYGKTIVALTLREIQVRWQYIFNKRNILILGGKGSGKTSLIYFLKNGKPYEERNGRMQPPEPTLGAMVLDANVRISKETQAKWAKIAKDLPGEKGFRDIWRDVIHQVDPHGIIYMVDGRLSTEQFKEAVADLFSDVLSVYTQNPGNLSTIHVFVNFADVWATDRRIRSQKQHAIEVYFENRLAEPEYQKLQHLRFQVSVIQLSLTKRSWDDAVSAIEKFGADLAGNLR